jgi:hypothetical protein
LRAISITLRVAFSIRSITVAASTQQHPADPATLTQLYDHLPTPHLHRPYHQPERLPTLLQLQMVKSTIKVFQRLRDDLKVKLTGFLYHQLTLGLLQRLPELRFLNFCLFQQSLCRLISSQSTLKQASDQFLAALLCLA